MLSQTMFFDAKSSWGTTDRREFEAAIKRTGVGYSGGSYGFTLADTVAGRVIDHARALSAVWGLSRWIKVKTPRVGLPDQRRDEPGARPAVRRVELRLGVERDRDAGASDSKLGTRTFVQQRLLLLSKLSRDVLEDADMLALWMEEAGYKELSANIEFAVVNGVLNGPVGLINDPATVVVSKGSTSSGQISAANIDAMWGAIPEANSYNAVWLCNKATAGYIDGLAASYPEIQYFPAAISGGPFATLKGRPVVWSEFSPALGAKGDLIVFDPTDFIFTYMDLTQSGQSPLAWTAGVDKVLINNAPVNPSGRRMLALPDGAVEQRMSDARYFETDEVACGWKLRADFGSVWAGTITGASGGTYGPCAVVQGR